MGESGTVALFGKVTEIFDKIKSYFNLFGKFYIQFQILCRVLVCSVFLDDLFEGADLECDTEQPGCQQNCVNRFAVVNHKKLWELEMFVIMFTTTLFTAFTYMNKKVEERYKKKKDGARKTFRFKEDGGVSKSGLTSMGYIVMLIVRLFCETWFLYLENQLSKHQSQKVGFWESFWLKENWICATNSPKPAAGRSLNELLPPANRSEIFWIDEPNLACMQQMVTVTCWIPFSRMKSYGMFFMYIVLLVGWFITLFELAYECIRLCTRASSRRRQKLSEQYPGRAYHGDDTLPK